MKLGDELGNPPSCRKYTPDERFVLPTRRIGVEFEFEGVTVGLPSEAWARSWATKPDGSLHDVGLEFVFIEPLFGVDAIEAINSLCAYARASRFKVSKRTGLHIHYDVRDFELEEFKRFAVLYALFERALYKFVGNDRDLNAFCLPWYSADAVVDAARKISHASSEMRKSRAQALAREKYAGLNLDTLARFGSVEFRHALCTTDERWILQWINLGMCLFKAAQGIKQPPAQIIRDLSEIGAVPLAERVFGAHLDALMYPQFDTDVWSYGLETALALDLGSTTEHTLPPYTAGYRELAWFKSPAHSSGPPNASFAAFMEKRKKRQKAHQESYDSVSF